MCLGQPLASKFRNNLNLGNKITKKICNPPNFYFPTQDKFVLPRTSPNLHHNRLCDRLWAPLL